MLQCESRWLKQWICFAQNSIRQTWAHLVNTVCRIGTKSPTMNFQIYLMVTWSNLRGYCFTLSKALGMPLKGTAQIQLYYGESGLRPMLDADVLVHTHQAEVDLHWRLFWECFNAKDD